MVLDRKGSVTDQQVSPQIGSERVRRHSQNTEPAVLGKSEPGPAADSIEAAQDASVVSVGRS